MPLSAAVQQVADVIIFPQQPASLPAPSARRIPGPKSRSDKMGADAAILWDGLDDPAHPPALPAHFPFHERLH